MSTRPAREDPFLDKLLRRPELGAYRNRLEAALAEGVIDRLDPTPLADWRRWRREAGIRGAAGVEELLAWSRRSKSDRGVQTLVKVLRALDPASPDLQAAEAARLARWRERHPPKAKARFPRVLTCPGEP